ncbi:hypothetical protein [Bacteroides sedimenti]|uniref:Uncharacterized protein n=1 Tax=Bacteroides sedimenti TaxID=2136147 RepID=A0ABM8IB17_9BACE
MTYEIIKMPSLLLPLVKKKSVREMQEFTNLVKGQFDYLMEQVTRFETDYFELSEKVHKMYQEVILLNQRLSESLKLQRTVPACKDRN